MWHDHPFSQRNKTLKIAVEVKVGCEGEEGLDKNLKSLGWQYKGGWGWGLHNIGGVRNPLPTISHKELFWKKVVLMVKGKCLELIVEELILIKVAG